MSSASHAARTRAGNILDNHDLISTLEKAKASAVDIAAQLGRACVTAREIDDVRVKYTAAARRGAILFFVMASLANITNMYEYSLASFLAVFNNTLATSRKDPNLEARLRHIVEAATSDVYNYTCLGLFERHKLMLSFQVRLCFYSLSVCTRLGSCPFLHLHG
jgi:dynein heavy chain, axonemal